MIRYLVVIGLAMKSLFLFCVPECHAEQIVIFANAMKPPKTYLAKGEEQGVLIEIMKFMDQQLPQSFTYKLYPWKRACYQSASGKGGIIGFSMNSERQKIFDYSEAMYYDEIMFIVLKDSDFTFRTIQDLQGKRVGVQRGASFGEEYEKAKNHIFTVDEDDSGTQRLRKLLSKHIDVALLGPGQSGFNYVVRQDKELTRRREEFRLLSQPFYSDPNYLAFPKKMNMRTFLKKFNQVLLNAKKSGVLSKIINNYLEQNK
jgi:ABC-type amino acid transport substrate-binding protein